MEGIGGVMEEVAEDEVTIEGRWRGGMIEGVMGGVEGGTSGVVEVRIGTSGGTSEGLAVHRGRGTGNEIARRLLEARNAALTIRIPGCDLQRSSTSLSLYSRSSFGSSPSPTTVVSLPLRFGKTSSSSLLLL